MYALFACLVLLVAACSGSSSATPGSPTGSPTLGPSPGTGATGSPSPSPTTSATPMGTVAPASIALKLVASGLSAPLYIADAGDAPGRLYVVEQAGRVMVVEGGGVRSTPFLDISDRVLVGSERGLLSMAFAPEYAQSGRFFVDYTDLDGDTVIERYERLPDGSAADPSSARLVLRIDQPAANHNGGLLLFGPDGYLYVGLGDGGGGGSENAQRPDSLLGKMLRLDVRADGYAIPVDNPFVADPAVRDEIWAMGLRHPWRYSFDRETGDLWIGDVGAVTWEEISFQAASSRGGENYGWPRMEGPDCASEPCDPADYVLPVTAYRHGEGDCVVVGGYVYRGSSFPELRGSYLFADYCSGRLWLLAAADAPSGGAQARLVLESGRTLSSFGEARDGELYLTDLSGGGVYQVVRGP